MIGRGAVTRRIRTARAAVSRVVLPTDDRRWSAKILSRRVVRASSCVPGFWSRGFPFSGKASAALRAYVCAVPACNAWEV